MILKVLYFAKSREVAETAEEGFELQPGATTQDLLAAMIAKHPKLEGVMKSCVLALNQEYLAQDESVVIKEGDEVAVIPPLSGG